MVTIDVVGIDEVLRRLEAMQWSLSQSSRKVVMEAARLLKPIMREEAPERTGALRQGIRYRTISSGETSWARFYEEGQAADYVAFVIEGTAAHEIAPTTKKALYWPGAGHPVAFVHHPGTQPNPFPERAMERLEREIDELLDATGEDIVQGVRIEAA